MPDPTGTGAIYLLTDQELLVSTDQGVTWRATGQPGFGALAIDPDDATHWWAAAQGGLYVRKGLNSAWFQKGKDVLSDIQQIYIKPGLSTTLYVSTANAVFRSTDGGETWGAAGIPVAGAASAIAFSPTDAHSIYIALVNQRGQLWKSTDDGKSWMSVGDHLPGQFQPAYTALSFDASGALYAATEAGLFSTRDGGSSWTQMTGEGVPDGSARLVMADPVQPGVVYASFDSYGLVRFSAQGSSPTHLGDKVFQNVAAIVPLPGQNGAIGILADGRFLLSRDSGATWASPSSQQVGAVWSGFAGEPGLVLAVEPNSGNLLRSADRGQTWTKLDLSGVQAMASAPKNGSLMYAGTAQGMFVSRDAGATWQKTGLPGVISVGSVALDPNNEQRLYVGKNDGLLRSEDAGQSWAGLNMPQNIGAITQIAVAADSSAIYMVGNNTLYRSADEGQTWSNLYSSNGRILTVSLSPSDPKTLYIGSGEGVGVSRDQGLHLSFTWPVSGTTLSYNGQFFVVEDPRNSQSLYAIASSVSNSGIGLVFVSPDGGQSWQGLVEGLPRVAFQSFAFDPGSPSSLYLVLQGGQGGVWQYTAKSLPPTPTPIPSATLLPTVTPVPTETPPPGATAGPTPTAWLQAGPTSPPGSIAEATTIPMATPNLLLGATSGSAPTAWLQAAETSTPQPVVQATSIPVPTLLTSVALSAASSGPITLPGNWQIWAGAGLICVGLLMVALAGLLLVRRGRRAQAASTPPPSQPPTELSPEPPVSAEITVAPAPPASQTFGRSAVSAPPSPAGPAPTARTIYCQSCGSPNDASGNFCIRCGRPLVKL